jgi:superfamily II DNA/RNA helicase
VSEWYDVTFAKCISPVYSNCLVIGGVNANEQLAQIRAGVDIVTGTPGRLNEFISSGQLCLSQVRFFILDEAVSV